VSTKNNTPDEAERLLDELCSCAADTTSLNDIESSEAFERVAQLRSQLLPLIRAGMAVQRLTAADPSRVKITDTPTGWNVTIELQRGEGHGSWGQTIPDAINAALNAAGAQ